MNIITRLDILISASVLGIVLGLFSVYVWPTRYKYYSIPLNGGAAQMRENRFTGEVEMLNLSQGRWTPVEFHRKEATQ